MSIDGIEEYLADLRVRQAAVRPAGVGTEPYYPIGERTLPAYVDHWARTRPQTTAIVFEGAELTYAQFADAVAAVAGWLDARGVRAGDRVGVYLPNAPQFIIAMLAALRIGAVHVPINPMFTPAELRHELDDSGAELVVTLGALLPRLDAVRAEGAVVRHVLMADAAPARDDVSPWAEAANHPAGPAPDVDLDSLAALNYTGGTTGLPKGCEHTHRHMIYTAGSTAAATGKLSAETVHVGLCYIPIFWIAGENMAILNPILLGGTSVLLPRWNADAALDAIERYGVSMMIGTVENYLELMEREDIGSRDLSSFDDPLAVSFVRKLTPDVRHAWAAIAGEHSVLREAAYGMTETHTYDASPYGMAAGDKDLLAEPVFCGIPVPGTDIAVVDPQTLAPLPIGEEGEIIVRSPSVTTGYWRNPAATAKQLVPGGDGLDWLRTGDNGRIDADGCLHYLGRDKDMIKVNGMSVFPAEVEIVVCRHPKVRTAAVVPADSERTGQVPVAFVALTEPGAADPAELREWCREYLSSYKVPLIEIVDEFPMTATGKIRKVELTTRACELAAR